MILDNQNDQRMMMMSKKASSFDQTKSTLVGGQQPSTIASSGPGTSSPPPPPPPPFMMVLNKKTPMIEPRFDPNGLVLPKKLPNPSLESREKKEIHREMLWKLKNNGGVANQDPKQTNEYRKVYQKYQQRLREKERQESNESVSFERMLEEHKQRLHSVHTGSLDSAISDDHHHHHHNLAQRDSLIDPSMDPQDGAGADQEQESYKKIFARLKSANKMNQDHSGQSPPILVHDSNNNNHNHNDKNSKLFGGPIQAATVTAQAKN